MEQSNETGQSKMHFISIKILVTIIISFILGIATFGLIQNIANGNAVTFSTSQLIGFVLSIMISGASIILAISAIMLGKFSEHAMIERSDESIRLQNEVFQKTTDALQRIESSTGVTEKRIEDIISGNVGDIAHKIAQQTTDKGKSPSNTLKIEEEIKKILAQSIAGDRISSNRRIDEKTRQEREEERKKQMIEEAKKEKEYQTLHQKVLSSFANRKDLTVKKTGHGNPGESGDDLFDGIYFLKTNEKIAISTFRDDTNREIFKQFIGNALKELGKQNNLVVNIFLFKKQKELIEIFELETKILAESYKNRFRLTPLTSDKIEENINQMEIATSNTQELV